MTVQIGSKWSSTHAIFRDEDTGTYFERNPLINTETELKVQKALLKPVKWPSDVTAWFDSVRTPETSESYQQDAVGSPMEIRRDR